MINRNTLKCLVLISCCGAKVLFAQSILFAPGKSVGESQNSNVGIGTSSPLTKFSVESVNPYISLNSSVQGKQSGLLFYDQSNLIWQIGCNYNNAGDNNLYFYRANGTGNVIFGPNGTGNVGINTVDPDAKLRVDGLAYVYGEGNGLLIDTLPATSARTGFMKYGGYEGMYVAGKDTLLRLAHRTDSGGVSGGSPSIREDLVVMPSGNVGIGTNNAGYKLDVVGESVVSRLPPGHPWGFGLETDSRWGGWARQYAFFSSGGMQFAAFCAMGNGDALDHIFLGQGLDLAGNPGSEWLTIRPNGNVGIGTTNPTQKLSVNCTIRAKEVVVETIGWSDYVLAKGYVLAPLSDVEKHIQSEGHLPGIPSAQEVAEKGVGVGEMQAKLLGKIEELTLRQIEQEKWLATQQKEIYQLKLQNAELAARVVAK